MKIVQINTTYGNGSTGEICAHISSVLDENGIENYVLFSSGRKNFQNSFRYSNKSETKVSALFSRVSGRWGREGSLATSRLIRFINKEHPDIVHLHNIHTHACNIRMLFSFLKKSGVKVVWTFHDCWAFTGNCTHYSSVGCEKWKKKCGGCPQNRKYSFFFDRTASVLEEKRALFCSVPLTIVCPSEWMEKQVGNSILKDVPRYIIKNGIDLSVFRPTKSDFRQRYACEGKIVILGVSSVWNKNKGLDFFIRLAHELSDDFKIVLVGTDELLDKQLPDHVVSIHRTQNRRELAEIYSEADVFLNPTREDTFPTVNMEAIACATPVITFDVGGSPETVKNGCGCVVEKFDFEALKEAIVSVVANKEEYRKNCIEQAPNFNMSNSFSDYLRIYHEISVRQ